MYEVARGGGVTPHTVLIQILQLKLCVFKYILKYRHKIVLISKDSESIEGDPIIIEYIFTVVTTNYILFYYMI